MTPAPFPPLLSSGGAEDGTKDVFKGAKNDLIAELKLSHNVGGISRLRSEQAKMQEEAERQKYAKFLSQFTAENFLDKVSNKVHIYLSSQSYYMLFPNIKDLHT